MTNLITKVMHNGTQYDIGGVTSVNGQTGAVTVEPGITKIFSCSNLDDAQDIYDRYASGGVPVVNKGGWKYFYLTSAQSTYLRFSRVFNDDSTNRQYAQTFDINVSSGTVTSIGSVVSRYIKVSSTVPTSGDSNTITYVI